MTDEVRGGRSQRYAGRLLQALVDLVVLSVAFWVAFLVRFEGWIPYEFLKRALFLWPYVILLQYAVLAGFGVPRFAWRQFSLREARVVLFATSAATGVLLVARVVAGAMLAREVWPFQYALLPVGVIAIDFLLAFLGIAGVRAARRLQHEHRDRASLTPSADPVPALLIGAGNAGAQVAQQLERHPELGLVAVGFLDDDPSKLGSVVAGVRVLGTTAELPGVLDRTGARQAFITIASARGPDVRRIADACDALQLPVKILPALHELVGGAVGPAHLRPVAIMDLLRREPVRLESDRIADALAGQVVLVTGAAGSIGAELCRQVARFRPRVLIAFDRAETPLFDLDRRLRRIAPELVVVPCVGDVTDARRVEEVLRAHPPSVVFHAAAYKHVPLMEAHPVEAIRNNIGGTRVVADLARAHGVATFVNVSTDKAVRPSSVMGATKRCTELYVQALAHESTARFVSVRFGNVLGSAGSVLGLFEEQIARGGPVEVTDPEMRRFFMTVSEASQLILQAAVLGQGGEVFVLDMGEQVRIVDLARDVIRLSGLTPDVDIAITFTGIRPGEKLSEELATAREAPSRTRHPSVLIGQPSEVDPERLTAALDDLAGIEDGERARARLFAILEELSPCA